MNKHIFIDRFALTLASWFGGKHKYFSASIDSPSYVGHIVNMDLQIPEIKQEGIVELSLITLNGQMEPAFQVVKWLGLDYPTIIYHHGNNERPFDYGKHAKNTFKQIILQARPAFDANLIVLRAPFHNTSLAEFRKAMLLLSNFTVMVSVSTLLIEALVSQLKMQSPQTVLVAGISLGGLVANLHRTHYNSADAYVPMLAGASPAEIFLQSQYRKITASHAKAHAQKLRQILNFDKDFKKIKHQNVFPLLARYDQYIDYEIQKHAYEGQSLKLCELGHITAVLKPDLLRNHLIEVLKKF